MLTRDLIRRAPSSVTRTSPPQTRVVFSFLPHPSHKTHGRGENRGSCQKRSREIDRDSPWRRRRDQLGATRISRRRRRRGSRRRCGATSRRSPRGATRNPLGATATTTTPPPPPTPSNTPSINSPSLSSRSSVALYPIPRSLFFFFFHLLILRVFVFDALRLYLLIDSLCSSFGFIVEIGSRGKRSGRGIRGDGVLQGSQLC